MNIPPNTTALVTLPNGEQHEVGSGNWQWQAEYQDPDARGPFTVDDLAGDILNDKRASTAVMDILLRIGAPEFVRGMIFGERNIALRRSLRIPPGYEDATALINEELAKF